MQETWVRSLAWEDPLEKGKATHSVSWPGESPGLYSPWKELDMTEGLSLPGCFWDFPSGSAGWNPPALQETQLWPLGREDPLEKKMSTYSSFLAWELPQTEELGGYSPWNHRVSHDWAHTHAGCFLCVVQLVKRWILTVPFGKQDLSF